MKLRFQSLIGSAAIVAGLFGSAFASPTPVSIDLTGLHAIQKYGLDEKADDHTYAMASGVAGGKGFSMRIPEGDKTFEAGPKKAPLAEKDAVTLWKGELNDGEFAIATVIVFQGEEKDTASVKKFFEDVLAAEKKTPEIDKKTLELADFKALTGQVDPAKKAFMPGDLVKNEQAIVAKVKDTFSRDKNTDHYSGLVNVVVWNDGTGIRKRICRSVSRSANIMAMTLRSTPS